MIKESDIEKLADLEQFIFTDAWTKKNIYETFCQQQATIFVAEEEEEIVAYCIVYQVLDEAEIVRIAVKPEMRRKGIGRMLLDYASGVCREKGVCRILLEVRESNEPARRFYDTYGFTEDGIRKNFYQNPVEHAI